MPKTLISCLFILKGDLATDKSKAMLTQLLQITFIPNITISTNNYNNIAGHTSSENDI
jgi:hypothetical protein